MNNRMIGAVLFSAAGLVAAIGVASSQIANAIVLGGFFAGNMTGAIPPSPAHFTLHWIVLITTAILAALGLYFLFRPEETQ